MAVVALQFTVSAERFCNLTWREDNSRLCDAFSSPGFRSDVPRSSSMVLTHCLCTIIGILATCASILATANCISCFSAVSRAFSFSISRIFTFAEKICTRFMSALPASSSRAFFLLLALLFQVSSIDFSAASSPAIQVARLRFQAQRSQREPLVVLTRFRSLYSMALSPLCEVLFGSAALHAEAFGKHCLHFLTSHLASSLTSFLSRVSSNRQ